MAHLRLVGTPLGNREDLSPRARQAILAADQLWCEDTRSPLRLLGQGSALPSRKSCFAGNEAARAEELRQLLQEGRSVTFVSEAGMPAISDPGQRLAEVAWECGATVEVIPGPTAAMTALVASGFPAQGAVFWGFLPRKGSRRDELLARIAASEGAFVLYEAGSRVGALLKDLAKELGEAQAQCRRLLIARELTKKHESLERRSVAEQLARLGELELRGEFTLVVEGQGPQAQAVQDPFQAGAKALWAILTREDLRPKARAREIAALTGANARAVYADLLAMRDSSSGD